MTTRRTGTCLLLAGWLALSSGCAVYDPFHVWRFGVDYNSERELSAQWNTYEHLPPKHVAVRLMKWRYNPGPSPQQVSYAIPANSPVEPVTPAPVGVLPGDFDDALDQAEPPSVLPLTPPLPHQPLLMPTREMLEPFGPTATSPSGSATTTVKPTSWMFAAP